MVAQAPTYSIAAELLCEFVALHAADAGSPPRRQFAEAPAACPS
jgi:hypothetical protein